jgi:signal transduction histidine kinase
MTLTASLEVLENSRADLTERAATALDLLSSDIDRFKVLVEDLLEISRFDVGTASLELSEIHLPEFLRQTIRYAGAAARLHVPPDRADLVVVADKRRLARVMSNLLDNAAKYGGGATDVSLRVDTSTVAIVIDDEGPGVPPQERAVIFDRFSRGGAGGRRGSDTGVGLGLAMVDEDVNLHGGRVWVTDRPGDTPGARFVVELPRSLEIPE